jgi:hypothetical protein
LITDIYFLSDAKYVAIGDNAFMNSPKLANISLPDSVEMIGSEAFYLYGGGPEGSLKLGKLPTNLKTLGDRAFCNAGPGVEISELPLGVTRVGTQCFMGCSNVTIHYFGGEGSSLERLGY